MLARYSLPLIAAALVVASVACSTSPDAEATATGQTGALPPSEKSCFPDLTDKYPGCASGCCHYALWEIATHCFDEKPSTPWRMPEGCAEKLPTPEKICENFPLRGQTKTVVAFDDAKMVKCTDPKFVHTLTIPREMVCGTDDPDRLKYAPDGFAMAWTVGATLIPEKERIGLVVNSHDQRSQNQLHIHSARLKPDARAAIEALPVKPIHVDQLGAVWTALTEHAEQSGFGNNYGAVVIADTARAGWLVASVDGTKDPQHRAEDMNAAEPRFTCWACDTCTE